MTRPGFGAFSSAVAQANAAIFRQHFDPNTLRPAATVKATMRRTRCGGLLTYTASAVVGRMTGRCSSAECLKWSD
ncbi:hypothetical protein [uncultured Variovorax sp.]|uniref:hypothetical protein n=1 Tax=uncultured Variovorax sp. TaxID=114708 RepID=UPI0025E8E749|nr:hypothetical protein [uncultured Variovorax sp.]